ncbi:glycoside hydrolase family 74 protein [Hydnum rufescens UP504]|uniref:Glycoside hydrolase family 74 protein n=1 Tax=Hydnum rufescens UP504 TaxID=1448309 RepID=A0A9P6DTH9_9AGAM|nr:glycoside hydrolase family 74 protein [Hydnum rufescens UP504]
MLQPSLAVSGLLLALLASEAIAQAYTWKNVHTGASGGWIGNVIFNTKQKGLAYLRTDIGGAYKLDSSTDTWTPLLDFADAARSNYWGCESIATDPVDPNNLYIAVGLYTNSMDGKTGSILVSRDQGASFTAVSLPFKVGGNMPGRGAGERLMIDPNNNKVLYFGARSGHGLWRSTDAGLTWGRVTSFPATGTYAQNPSDTSGYNSDPLGVGWIVFDTTSSVTTAGTSRIFVGVLSIGSPSIWMSNNAGVTWSAVAGQSTTYLPHHGVLSPAEKSLYISYVDASGPFDGGHGTLAKYNVATGVWTNITPAQAVADNRYGFGGLTIDPQRPGTVMAASLDQGYPDAQIWRSLDGGHSWTTIYSYSYPAPSYELLVARSYDWDLSTAPWIKSFTTSTRQVGWGIEGLQIDPFDSNHLLWGTGLTLYGTHNLLQWDADHSIKVSSLSVGVEETAVLGLVSPPVGPHLVSAVGDIGGWAHTHMDVAPSKLHLPLFGTVTDIDYAGSQPTHLVRIGNSAGQIAVSTDSAATWTLYAHAPSSLSGGCVAYSARGTSIVWTTRWGSYVAKDSGAFVGVNGLPAGAIVEADKSNDAYFYASLAGKVYSSWDGGASFSYVSSLGSSTRSNGIAVNNLGRAGELYISTNQGIWHSTNYGQSVVQLSGGLTQAWGIAVGAPRVSGGTPSVFAAGIVNGVTGLFRTSNNGASWTQINDAAHGFATVSAVVLAGDPRIYKRVYVGTNGRGIFYGS